MSSKRGADKEYAKIDIVKVWDRVKGLELYDGDYVLFRFSEIDYL